MKLCAQMGLLIALAVALTFTYWPAPTQDNEPIPGTGPVLQPHPITLRVFANNVIVRAVIDDGLPLPDAAALCREMYSLLPNASGPVFIDEHVVLDRPPATDEERYCRQVIGWVRVQTYDRPADGSVARLEAEYCDWLCQGTGRLPAPAELCPSPADVLEQARADWQAQAGKRRSRIPRPLAE
jgi:hypothetical protein